MSFRRTHWPIYKTIALKILTLERPIDQQQIPYIRLAMLGLGGVCFIATTQILTLPRLDNCLRTALVCFSVAIPFLITAAANYESFLGKSRFTFRCELISVFFMLFGDLLGFIGLAAIFWHFHWLAGLLFLIASAIGLSGTVLVHYDLEALKKDHALEDSKKAQATTIEAGDS